MGPVMAAWPQCCQAAVPSQLFPELLVIAHAQSDSQRQMVFKLNGCGRNLGAGLISRAHARDCQDWATTWDTPIGRQLAERMQCRPVISCLSVIFSIISTKSSKVIGLGVKWEQIGYTLLLDAA